MLQVSSVKFSRGGARRAREQGRVPATASSVTLIPLLWVEREYYFANVWHFSTLVLVFRRVSRNQRPVGHFISMERHEKAVPLSRGKDK